MFLRSNSVDYGNYSLDLPLPFQGSSPMALKKSELYSSLWASCDALRGGMDASQYKDYVLVMLFWKYVSDKAVSDPYSLIEVPPGCSFTEIAKLKHHKDIGERMDTAIGAIARANGLQNVIDVAVFNDEEMLGKGKEMVDTLSKLIAIFENPALDFSKNKAGGDDLLGDAYEYLMRHFATESGKAKGQFYTPAEVSRIMAMVLEIPKGVRENRTFYDPTCGSGSLLLKVGDEHDGKSSLYGQEKDNATGSLAKMNMILHGNDAAEIVKGQSTLSNPLFFDDHGYLKTFDFAVANPPFSSKNWMQGFDPQNDEHNRFTGYGMPPQKNGDYAFLLHIIASLKSSGKGAIILPHGVLFRGNAEAEIRRNIIRRGLIKGIIGLPANLFYGTGIPACIIVIDKAGAPERKGIFMIDASKGFIKDGNKNRLREQDIHRIVDVFNKQTEIPGYSRLVAVEEIADPKNDFNLNIPRYIESQEVEDIQDIAAHLYGGIPERDVDGLQEYWTVFPGLRSKLFTAGDRPGYFKMLIDKGEIKAAIFEYPEFRSYSKQVKEVFGSWSQEAKDYLQSLDIGCNPRQVIAHIGERLLEAYALEKLLNNYDIYQHLMDYWAEVMQDDLYLIAEAGWESQPYRVTDTNKSGKQKDKGWNSDLIPPALMISEFFADQQNRLQELEAEADAIAAELDELVEEQNGDEGYFSDFDKVNKGTITRRLKEIRDDKEAKDEVRVMKTYLDLSEKQSQLKSRISDLGKEIDRLALAQYQRLTPSLVKEIVVGSKWMKAMEAAIERELERVSQRLTGRIKELMERYETPLPFIEEEINELDEKVKGHLRKMGFTML